MEKLRNSLRKNLWNHLRVHSHSSEGLSYTNFIIIILILLMIAIMTARSEPSLPLHIDLTLKYVQIAIWFVFVLEWLARLWTAVEDPRFEHYKYPRLHWLTRITSILDLIAILPGFILIWDNNSNLSFLLRLFRLIMLIRFIRFFRYSQVFEMLGKLFSRHWKNITVSLSILLVIVYLLASCLWLVEHKVNPDFSSIPKAFWWAVVSITTVGYGDAYPITALGKAITASFLLLSMAFLALPGSIMAAGFMEILREKKEKEERKAKSKSWPNDKHL